MKINKNPVKAMDFPVAVALGYATVPGYPPLSPWRIRWNRFLAWLRPKNPPRLEYERRRMGIDLDEEQVTHLSPREAHDLVQLTKETDIEWKKVAQVPGGPDPGVDTLRKVFGPEWLSHHPDYDSTGRRRRARPPISAPE